MKGWHFLREDRRLGYGDGRQVRVGRKQVYRGDGPIVLCERGMHGSKRIIDALNYADSPIVSWCEYGGEIIQSDDKFVAEWRRPLWIADISRTLHLFACDEAQRALDARRKEGHTIDPRSYAAIAAKRGWLLGVVSDDELDAAYSAAYSAARGAAPSAARGAAYSTAYSAAYSAAHSAAYSAARSTAHSAAYSAARSGARTAARSAAYSAARTAARSGALSAAYSAALSAQNRRLTAQVRRLMEWT